MSPFSLIILTVGVLTLSSSADSVITCYYRFGDPPPSLVPGNLCTHIILIGETVLDHLGHFQQPPEDVATQFVGIKHKFPEVKLLLCQTGSNPDFSTLVEDEESMERYARESSDYLRERDFDGLDLDWEFPTKPDRTRFTALLKSLRKAFGSDLLLTAAVSGPPTITIQAYEVPPFNEYLDLVNIMNYDFHRSSKINWVVGFNAPLYKMKGEFWAIGEMNSATAMWTYDRLGLWRNKTLFGIPTYNVAFLLINRFFFKPYSLAEHEVDGYENRAKICELMTDTETYTYVWNKRAASPYIHGKNKLWISIEDERSVSQKAAYAADLGVRGVMVYHIGSDDVYGLCGNGEFPLLNAIAKQIRAGSNKV